MAADPARAETVTIGSKWGYTYVAGWKIDADPHEVKDHGLATFTRQVTETRELLGDHLALYQIHSASLSTGVLDDPEVWDALSELAESGVVIGMSLSGPDQPDTLRRALELSEAGRVPFRSVQATWNLLERSAGDALAEAADAGWGITIKEAVANGRLTPRGQLPAAFRAAADELGLELATLATAVALAQSWAHVVLSGATTVEHLDGHLDALEVTLPDGLDEELAASAEAVDEYWNRRRALPWN